MSNNIKTIRFASEPESERVVISIEGVNINDIEILRTFLSAFTSKNGIEMENRQSDSLEPNVEETSESSIRPKYIGFGIPYRYKDDAKAFAKKNGFQIKWNGREWDCPSEYAAALKEHLAELKKIEENQ